MRISFIRWTLFSIVRTRGSNKWSVFPDLCPSFSRGHGRLWDPAKWDQTKTLACSCHAFRTHARDTRLFLRKLGLLKRNHITTSSSAAAAAPPAAASLTPARLAVIYQWVISLIGSYIEMNEFERRVSALQLLRVMPRAPRYWHDCHGQRLV